MQKSNEDDSKRKILIIGEHVKSVRKIKVTVGEHGQKKKGYGH